MNYDTASMRLALCSLAEMLGKKADLANDLAAAAGALKKDYPQFADAVALLVEELRKGNNNGPSKAVSLAQQCPKEMPQLKPI